MKTIYPSDQVFHRWAHQRDAHRISNGKHGNLSAEGACLYSYAECIGIIDTARNIAYLSSYRWSPTTSKHQSYAARAIPSGLSRVYLDCRFPSDGSLPRLADLAQQQAAQILRNIDHDNKARKINNTISQQYATYCALQDFASTQLDVLPAVRIETLQELRDLRDGKIAQDHADRLNRQAGALKLSIDAARNVTKQELWHGVEHAIASLRELPTVAKALAAQFADRNLPAPDYLGKLPAQANRLLPALARMKNARDEELLRINADKCEAWRRGERVYDLPRSLPPMLRLYRSTCADDQGDMIQTSWGASVPVAVAPWIWELVQRARASDCSTTFTAADNIQVGDYRLEEVSATGAITVGCHVIAYSELERMAQALGLIAAPVAA